MIPPQSAKPLKFKVMYLYKIEVYDPIAGFTYPNEIYGSLYAAKQRLKGIIEDIKKAGVDYYEKEEERFYEFSYEMGMFAYYAYKIHTVGYVGFPDQDKREGV